MDPEEQEEALIYAINSADGNQTAINHNWVSPQQQQHQSSDDGGGEVHTNGGHYLPEHSIGLLVCIVGDTSCQDVYGQCIEETFR